ncbi:hypothetical protein D9M72_559470 [compost metagenome]
MIGLAAFGNDDCFAGAGGGAAHAVYLLAVGVGAADHAQQQCVARRAWQLRGLRQILQAKEHAFAGAAAHIGGRDFDLGHISHGCVSFCLGPVNRP